MRTNLGSNKVNTIQGITHSLLTGKYSYQKRLVPSVMYLFRVDNYDADKAEYMAKWDEFVNEVRLNKGSLRLIATNDIWVVDNDFDITKFTI